MCSAASTSLALSVPVTPDINDKTSRWEYRVTSTYDGNNNKYFSGAVETGAGEYAISMFTQSDTGATLTKAGLTPAGIYSDANDTASALVANPLYNAKVWEMDCYSSGEETYVAAIMQLAGETGVGGSVVAVIKASDPKETYISGPAMSLNSEVADATLNTASRFVKLIVGMLGSATTRIVFAAVADPTTGEFDTSKSTVGLRAFRIPATISDYSLAEVDMLSGDGKGVKLGNTAAMMSNKMRKLTSMVWDARTKVLYFGGYMSDDTLGICGFYVNGSDLLTTLNNTTGGTLCSLTTPTGYAELSRIHRMAIQTDGTKTHLIVQAGASSKEQTNIYALSTVSGVAGTVGKLAQGASTTLAAGRATTWLAPAATGVYTSVARVVVGNAPFPLAPGAVITGMAVSGNVVYVSTWNANQGTSDVWKATASLASNFVSSWTAWQNLANTTLNNVTAFATNGTYAWAVLNRSSVYVNSAVGSAYTQVQPSLGLANAKASTSRNRLRKLAAFDAVNRQLILSANGTPDGHSMSSVHNYAVATGVNAAATEAADDALTLGAGVAIWDTATITHDGVTDRFYLLQDDCTTPKPGGSTIVKVSGEDGTVTAMTTASFFKDGAGSPAASKCFKIVGGAKLDGTPILFCFIPDATNKDLATGFNADTTTLAADGQYDIIKALLASDMTTVVASVKYKDIVNPQDANITAAQCAYFDDTLKVLYIGAQKASGDDPGLAFLKLSGTTITSGLVVPGGQANNDTIKDIWQLSSLHTPVDGGTSRNILLMAATLTGDAGDVNTGGVYALPIFSTAGATFGQAAQTAYTPVAVESDTTWDTVNRPDLFTVGGTVPWNAKAAIIDIQVVGQDVYVTVANPPGVIGQAGVFVSSAVSAAGALLGWTPWAPVASLSSSMQNVAFDATSGQVIGVDLASGSPAVASWKTPGSASSFDKLAAALNADFSGNGGVYNLTSHSMSSAITYTNSTGYVAVSGVYYPSTSANLIVATGNKKVALGHVQYKNDANVTTQYNPDASNIYGYKCFNSDAALQAVGNIYCSAVSLGRAGWVVVGGENGIAILRDPATGNGWTGSVPKDLQDVTSTTVAPANMTWLKLPGITGPIYSMTTVYEKTAHTESIIAIGKGGVYAFKLVANKFTDDEPASLGLANVTVLSATAGASERMWALEPLYRGMGVVAVGTTRGLYIAQYDTATDPDITALAEVVDADELSLGPVSSITASNPIFTASTNIRYTIDCVTANARTDVSKHYRTGVTFVHSSGAITGTYIPSLVTTLDRMTTQIVSNASVNMYAAGVPNKLQASLKVLSKTLESSASPVSSGLTLPAGSSSMGRATVVGADGSRLVTVDGCVYVQSV
jgi:hypothetical protein